MLCSFLFHRLGSLVDECLTALVWWTFSPSHIEARLSEETARPIQSNHLLSKWGLISHLTALIWGLKLFSAAPPRRREECVNCPVVVTGVLPSYLNAKPCCLFTVEAFSLSVHPHSCSKTTQKWMQFYFQCSFSFLSYLQLDLEIPIHLPVDKGRNKLGWKDKRQESRFQVFYSPSGHHGRGWRGVRFFL